MTNELAKVPPHNIEAEKSVLGALLLDKQAMIKIADVVGPIDFYHDGHQIIYEHIFLLYQQRKPIDLLTLASLLEDNNKLEIIGDRAYLAELIEAVPTSTHIVQYATIVKEKAILRRLIRVGNAITALGFEEQKDIGELIDSAEKELFSVSQNLIKDKFIHIKEVLAGTYEKISDLHDPDAKDKYKGVPTGFKNIDAILSGLQPSDLIIIAARPSMGKTALALNFAQNAAEAGKSIGIISLEMSKEQLVERMFCSILTVDSWKMRTGQLTEGDFSRIGGVMDQMNSMNIFIDDAAGGSIVELRAKARRLQMEHGLDMLIIDYLQLMSAGGFKNNRVQEISEISRSLKGLARELKIPIVALSQLSRAVESRPVKIPMLSDLRESGAIEQDADIVVMLYREDYYEEDTERAGITDIFIRKHRNGPIGRAELIFKKEQLRFYDREKSRDHEDAF